MVVLVLVLVLVQAGDLILFRCRFPFTCELVGVNLATFFVSVQVQHIIAGGFRNCIGLHGTASFSR